MNDNEIKSKIEALKDVILLSNQQIKNIQNTCTHTHTEEANISYRFAAANKGYICSICGKILNNTFPSLRNS